MTLCDYSDQNALHPSWKLRIPNDTPIEHNMITRSLGKAQKKVEQFHFSARKQILEFDNVLDKQRETVYTLRRQCLRDGTILEKLSKGFKIFGVFSNCVSRAH